MRILALETAVQPGSIAVLENAEKLAQFNLPARVRTTRSLMPAIARQLAELNWHPSDLDLVAVSRGPGSFTGLRVGVTVAKTLAYAIDALVLGIDTLDVIAEQSFSALQTAAHASGAPRLWVVMDAQRQQLFCARYERIPAGGWQRAGDVQVLGRAAWREACVAGDLVSGPGVENLREWVAPHVVVNEDALAGVPQAATVGQLAHRACATGRRDDLWGLVPHYHRLSAAEEKRAAAKRQP